MWEVGERAFAVRECSVRPTDRCSCQTLVISAPQRVVLYTHFPVDYFICPEIPSVSCPCRKLILLLRHARARHAFLLKHTVETRVLAHLSSCLIPFFYLLAIGVHARLKRPRCVHCKINVSQVELLDSGYEKDAPVESSMRQEVNEDDSTEVQNDHEVETARNREFEVLSASCETEERTSSNNFLRPSAV